MERRENVDLTLSKPLPTQTFFNLSFVRIFTTRLAKVKSCRTWLLGSTEFPTQLHETKILKKMCKVVILQ